MRNSVVNKILPDTPFDDTYANVGRVSLIETIVLFSKPSS